VPSQFTVTVVLTLKFFYKRSFGFKIKWCPPKVIWKRCGEWHKLEDKQKLEDKKLEDKQKLEDSPDIVEHDGFPNYKQILDTKYPGDKSFGDGDTASLSRDEAEVSPFSNVSLSCKCSRKQVAPM
jgi:hypothetical protein